MSLIDPATGTEWSPEFDGQRPPFQPGNELAVTHGAYSPAKVNPIAEEHYAGLMADPNLPTLLRLPFMQGAVTRYCEATARRDLVAAWVDGQSIQQAADSDRGKISALELLRKMDTTVLNMAKDLGITPSSYARIHRDSAIARQADAATLLTKARAEAEGR